MTSVAEEMASLEKWTYPYLLEKLLGQVPEDIDRREGSIIYDALAPIAYNLAEFSFEVREVLRNAYAQTAYGEFLDYKAYEQGLSRELATATRVRAYFSAEDGSPFVVKVGDRFASIGVESYFYQVTESRDNGTAVLIAEEAGSRSAQYVGAILPITPQNGLVTAVISDILEAGQDVESDESLRKRLLNNRQDLAFGGNMADYIKMTQAIDGVSHCQIYPAWQGGGTVKVVVLGNNLEPASQALQAKVKEVLDPEVGSGLGLGLAPIGHRVTVVAPTKKVVDVSVRLIRDYRVPLREIEQAIQELLENYQRELRESWGVVDDRHRQYEQTLYKAQLLARLMTIAGVVNISELRLTVDEQVVDDLSLVFSNEQSDLATFGKVVVSE